MKYSYEFTTKLDNIYKELVYLLDSTDDKVITIKGYRLLTDLEDILYEAHAGQPEWMPSNLF